MLILGSASARRNELLGQFNIPFVSEISAFDEEAVPLDLEPSLYVSRIAEGKGALLAERFPDRPILTADTTVHQRGLFYNKPASREEAISILMRLQNDMHEVFTGVSIRKGSTVYTEVMKTEVFFHPLTKAQIESYIETFQPFDKAGGYSIQDGGGILVKAIQGDYFNVLGLPITAVASLLNKIGVNLWDYLKR